MYMCTCAYIIITLLCDTLIYTCTHMNAEIYNIFTYIHLYNCTCAHTIYVMRTICIYSYVKCVDIVFRIIHASNVWPHNLSP